MNAIILCAGFSTRLKPLTINQPKCLIKYSKINLLEFWIRKLINSNVKKILVNTHFNHKKIKDYLSKHPYKDRIIISHEKKLLGTGGTLMKNLNFFENTDGILLHGDNFIDDNFKKYILMHKKRPLNCLMSMITFKTNYPNQCGIIKTSKEKILTNFYEKPKIFKGNNANGAIYFISKKMIQEFKNTNRNFSDFSTEIIPKYLNKIYCMQTNNFFSDIGDLKKLNFLKLKKRFYTN